MEHEAELLRRRIARNRGYLKAGVIGSLAIRYLRQIADDDEALSGLADTHASAPAPDSRTVSPYLTQPRRSLFMACREMGRDGSGRRCPACPLKCLCDAGRLLRRGTPLLQVAA